jgi:hypothetical protein
MAKQNYEKEQKRLTKALNTIRNSNHFVSSQQEDKEIVVEDIEQPLKVGSQKN